MMDKPSTPDDPTDSWIDQMIDAPGEKYTWEIKPELDAIDWHIEQRLINDKPVVLMRTRVEPKSAAYFKPRLIESGYLAAVKLDHEGEAELVVLHPGRQVTMDVKEMLQRLERDVAETTRRGESA